MLSHMRLSKFELDVRYKNSLLNMHADALSCLRSLGETTVPVDAEILTCPFHSDATPDRGGEDDFNTEL